MATTTYYAIVILDESTPDDPDGLVRVIEQANELRSEFYDIEDSEWVEDNTSLARLYDPMEIDGTLVEVPRATAEAIMEHIGAAGRIDEPAKHEMDYGTGPAPRR